MGDVILDFHGTLYRDESEGPLWEHVAKQAIKPLEIVKHPLRTVAFAKAKSELEELKKRHERGEIGYDEIYRAFNRLVLSRLPKEFVRAAIRSYAGMPGTRQKLDMRVLNAVRDSCMMKGVLSTGSSDFIGNVMPQGYFIPKWIVANTISRNGGGSVLNLSVYGNKPEHLGRYFFGTFTFDPKRTVYMGDNEDEEPAFEYVLERGGKVAMPFYATNDFKQHAATRYRAFVPETEQDLAKFLRSV